MATNSKAKGPYQGDLIPPEIRFWSKVKVLGPDDCWDWQGSLNNYGYGEFGLHRRVVKAHRFSYAIVRGTIPPGAVLRHSCHRPSCVNPYHLTPGTQKENVADFLASGRPKKVARRLTLPEKEAMRRLRALGMSPTELAQKFGVTIKTIQRWSRTLHSCEVSKEGVPNEK